MSGQQVLIVTRVALFELANGGAKTTERGNCACAIVAAPGTTPPRYSLVCYNDARETLCVSSIKSNNDHSLQFHLQVNDYASFRDDNGNPWSMMFLKSAQLEKFCAVLGAAFYGASGAPSHTAVIGDFSPSNIESKVSLQHRVKARYSTFAIRVQPSNGLHVVEDLLETNGDRPYNFQPSQSSMAREDAKGFESCVLGMAEEGTRAIVVPSAMPRAGRSPYPGVDVVVFVVQIIRVLNDGLAVDGATTVPTVFGNGGSGGGALVLHNATDSSNSSLVAVRAPESSSTVRDVPLAAASGVPGAIGSGVPAEHMMMIQKAAGMINTSTTMTRDLHDKLYAFSEDWKQSVNRPKPSTLTNQGLEQSVKQLIVENEKMRDDLVHRDDLIRSLDERNRGLQKRVDTAAMVAQQLMDEKNKTVSNSNDSKLDKDRQIMKVQEQITACSNERDDVHRHLTTVKKLLEVSDNELRDTRGKIDVHSVMAQSLATKLDASEDALSEERSRRKALEAKVLALQDEIREAEADLHTRTASLEELHRKADGERTYQAQLMEDERQRRSFDAQQLRSEIVNELHQREHKFQADRARVAEDHFKRGHDEGKQIGRNHARIDVETRLEELMLDAQRAKTELDAYKTELRSHTEEAMGENRRLEAIVLQLKKSTDEGTRRKAQNEFQLQALRLKVRNAEDALLLSMTSIAHRLTRPAEPQDLISTLSAIREGENPRLQFQVDAHKKEKEESFAQRNAWMTEDAEALYLELLTEAYESHVSVVESSGSALRDTMCSLWLQRDETDRSSLLQGEAYVRSATEEEALTFFIDLAAWQQHLNDERDSLLNAEVSERHAAELDSDIQVSEFCDALRAFLEQQAAERLGLESEETTQREETEKTLNEALHVAAGDFLLFLEGQRNERDAVYTEETSVRRPIDDEAEAFFVWIDLLRSNEADERHVLEGVTDTEHISLTAEEDGEWREIVRQHETVLFAGLIAAQDALNEEEQGARAVVAEEETSPWEELLAQAADEHKHIDAIESEQKRIALELIETQAEEASARASTEQAEDKEFTELLDNLEQEGDALRSIAAAAPVGASALNRNSVAAAPTTSHQGAPATSTGAASPPAAQKSAANDEDPLFGSSSGVRASLVKKTTPFGADSDGSDSDGAPKPKAPVPAAKKSSAASPTAKSSSSAASPTAAANLFGSDSDSDGGANKPKPKAPPKKAARKAPPKKTNASMFDSDDD